MRRRLNVYVITNEPRWIVLYDAQRAVLECQRVEPATDLPGAMAAAILRLEGEGWQAEGPAPYGFVFVRRGQERRLLSMTPRDPADHRPQMFSPFRDDAR